MRPQSGGPVLNRPEASRPDLKRPVDTRVPIAADFTNLLNLIRQENQDNIQVSNYFLSSLSYSNYVFYIRIIKELVSLKLANV